MSTKNQCKKYLYERMKSKIDGQLNELSKIKIKIQQRENVIGSIVNTMKLNNIKLSDIGKHLKCQPVYIDEATGKTWSGRGRRPKWFILENATLYTDKGGNTPTDGLPCTPTDVLNGE